MSGAKGTGGLKPTMQRAVLAAKSKKTKAASLGLSLTHSPPRLPSRSSCRIGVAPLQELFPLFAPERLKATPKLIPFFLCKPQLLKTLLEDRSRVFLGEFLARLSAKSPGGLGALASLPRHHAASNC
jgi:hypothetical protein